MPSERFTGLSSVLNVIRSADGITQPMLVDRVGLGRSVVSQRVAELEAAGLVAADGTGPSTGGRAPRRLRLRAEAGHVLAVDIASNELVVGVADLSGRLRASEHRHIDLSDGPEHVLAAVLELGDAVINQVGARADLRSVGVGMPGPVSHGQGAAAALPTMPEWDRFAVRDRLASAWPAPVWLDDRVNLLVLGERRVNPLAARAEHMVYLGGGATLSAAVVVDGHLYRGARGLAGAIGHIAVPGAGDVVCSCGNTGCLDAVAGSGGLVRDARVLAETGQSPALAAVLAEAGILRPIDITQAAGRGDPAARALLHRSGLILGRSLATLVNVLNPEIVIIGGGLARARAHLLAAIRESVYAHALPAATRGLRIESSMVDDAVAGVTGAVEFALSELFSPENLPDVLDAGHSSAAG
jgi:predicted NBD/HSP70 family sugar kinase